MKRVLFFFLTAFLYQTAYSQVYNNAWSVGATLNSVRMTAEVRAEDLNFGGNVFVQKDINETHAIRAVLSFGHFTSKGTFTPTTDNFLIGADYLLKFAQQGPIYPYLGAGFAISYYDVSGSPFYLINGGNFGDISANLFFGALVDVINDDWKLKVEFGQHTLSTDSFDGLRGNDGGLFGGSIDSYIEFGIGVQYYFDNGDGLKSSLPQGITQEAVDYKKIEAINKKYAPEQDTKKIDALQKRVDVLNNKIDKLLKNAEKPRQTTDGNAEVTELTSVYFKFNSTDPTADSYTALVHLSDAMLRNKTINVELIGRADDTGLAGDGDAEKSAEFNNSLSRRRAEFVRDYCVKQGINASRIKISFKGANSPVADNSTESGRALNRSVEIKVLK